MLRSLLCSCLALLLCGVVALAAEKRGILMEVKDADKVEDGKTTIGAPAIKDASVTGDVVKHIRGEKKVAFKMKRRKGFHKKTGHRQELTVIKIKEINA